jgi:hypothetical protein
MIELRKSLKAGSVDVILIRNDALDELIFKSVLKEDIEKCVFMKKAISRLRSLKLDTLQTKIFGNNEAMKWGD